MSAANWRLVKKIRGVWNAIDAVLVEYYGLAEENERDSDRPSPESEDDDLRPAARDQSRSEKLEDESSRGVDPVKEALKAVSKETLEFLPGLLTRFNKEEDALTCQKYSFNSCRRLTSTDCPNLPSPATINVLNDDTLNVAIELWKIARQSSSPQDDQAERPLLINFASYKKPGGGWKNGAMAQEEALCYRSSLSLSLHKEHYPLKIDRALYSPYVLVIRTDYASGHQLPEKDVQPEDLPVVSAITIAALERPLFDDDNTNEKAKRTPRYQTGPDPSGAEMAERRFTNDSDRERTKAKMRLSLRIAARHGHRRLVLGALGCGVYGNPPLDIAHCWLEVLTELEFRGNWWSDVCFAVYDTKGDGNFDIFQNVLGGKMV